MKKVTLPTIALRCMTVLPDMVIHFDISRKKSINAVKKAMEDGQKIFLLTQRDEQISDPDKDDLYNVGTVAQIKQIIKLPDSITRVMVEGAYKANVNDVYTENNMLISDITPAEDINHNLPDELTSKAMVDMIHELLRRFAAVNVRISRDIVNKWLSIYDLQSLFRRVVIDYPMTYINRQHFLEISDVNVFYENLAKLIMEDIEISRIKDELAEKVKAKVNKNQKDYIIREQMKVLSEELDGDGNVSETDEFYERLQKLDADEMIKESISKEIRRYKMLSQGSSEANVERGYIETLLAMPWDKESCDNTDLDRANEILDRDHYGMTKIKERILETLAVRNVCPNADTPIICLVGPPGTGKTSIARSVADALNKEYVRICLGGVKDEAEIRGHRKTYVGAMPGRIIAALKQCKVKNPLMLLDEIDKMSSDYKSDTASALLEVLDSEQNSHFVDHYIELPTDLSKVLFIATANDISQVSRPLLDRMEIIEINSYTKNEKLHIAKEHLIPKQIKKNGLLKKHIRISDKAVEKIIDSYTREAGVRSLEREISKICRKAVRKLYLDGKIIEDFKQVSVTEKNLEEYLGKEKFSNDVVNKKNETGIVRGLAWTSVGGETLEIEVNTMPGGGELILTGQMGDVMKESARIALSYVKSVACTKKYGVAQKFFEENDIHLHIPEGAVPKDGPSAGVTMATALLSAAAEIPVDAKLAMTGEVTLRGRVLKIGGLKEKLLAAKTAGVKRVVVPKDNMADIEEFDAEITDNIEIVYAEDMSDVLKYALVK